MAEINLAEVPRGTGDINGIPNLEQHTESDTILILGSSSPRRAALLKQIGAEFIVRAADVDETYDGASPPQAYAENMALKKALAVRAQIGGGGRAAGGNMHAAATGGNMHAEVWGGRTAAGRAIIIGADTIVVGKNGEMLGKPKDAADAKRMLALLSGSWHEVYTGVALACIEGSRPLRQEASAASGSGAGGRPGPIVKHEKTRVLMCDIDEETINRYVASGEPMGKAGGYAVQGAGSLFIERIEGCYYNVVGLPLRLLHKMLLAYGCGLV